MSGHRLNDGTRKLRDVGSTRVLSTTRYLRLTRSLSHCSRAAVTVLVALLLSCTRASPRKASSLSSPNVTGSAHSAITSLQVNFRKLYAGVSTAKGRCEKLQSVDPARRGRSNVSLIYLLQRPRVSPNYVSETEH